ncbi:MAG: hypothetical protein JKY94_12800 [Rhodobacteraceae bacterium]|nr:hypothetical protein [Paracoccaceae bacterium]
MRTVFFGALAVLGMMFGSVAVSATLQLQPANPQPSASQLKKGLAVRYAYAPNGAHIKQLADARRYLKAGSERGKPLKGLDYRDTREGSPTLTSKRAMNVAASISGYVRFDKPGLYNIDFLTNDGLEARIGGQRVGHFDGRQPCGNTYTVTVNAPAAGWYELSAIYFQRLGTSCLHMRIAPEGKQLNWAPNSMFGHK